MFNSILVVCTGNICRSPMAEALLASLVGDGVSVTSAGVSALVGHPAEEHARAVCAAAGLNIGAHRARQAGPVLLKAADLILALDSSHVTGVCQLLPSVRGKTFLLGHWLTEKEIKDPYQQGRAAFEHAFSHIEAGVASWLTRL